MGEKGKLISCTSKFQLLRLENLELTDSTNLFSKFTFKYLDMANIIKQLFCVFQMPLNYFIFLVTSSFMDYVSYFHYHIL